jgi:hypothetical protein
MKRFLMLAVLVAGASFGSLAVTDTADAQVRVRSGGYYGTGYNYYAPRRSYYRNYAPRYYSRGYYNPYQGYYRGGRGYYSNRYYNNRYYNNRGGVFIGGPRGGLNIRW